MSMFLNRLKKNHAHLRKWARRVGTEAWRVYDKDIPEYPFAVDLYGPCAVVHEYDEGFEDDAPKREEVVDAVMAVVGCRREDVFVKIRRRIRERTEQYERVAERGAIEVIAEQGLRFRVNLSDYLDTGLFLDHRKSRAWVRDASAGKRVLNLFCYTGSVSVFAAAGGASEVVSVDLSNTYLDWARENFRLNGVNPDLPGYSFVRDDALKLLGDLRLQGRSFDLVFVDPPSFSNSKKMDGHFDVQEHHTGLLLACARVLDPSGVIFFSNNNRRFRIDEEGLAPALTVESVTERTLPEDFRNRKVHNSWLLRPR